MARRGQRRGADLHAMLSLRRSRFCHHPNAARGELNRQGTPAARASYLISILSYIERDTNSSDNEVVGLVSFVTTVGRVGRLERCEVAATRLELAL